MQDFMKRFLTKLEQRPGDIIVIFILFILLIVYSFTARYFPLDQLDIQIFRAINESTIELRPLITIFLYMGTYPGAITFLLISLWKRNKRLAEGILITTLILFLLEFSLKLIVGRDRPGGLIEDVILREQLFASFGFPSGHTALSVALALIISPYVNKPVRILLVIYAALVAIGRIYVGVHFPSDVLGGVFLGLIVGMIMRFFYAPPVTLPEINVLKDMLRGIGLPVKALRLKSHFAMSSIPAELILGDGRHVFLKITTPNFQTVDWLYKIIRRISFRENDFLSPFLDIQQKVEHEGFMMMFASQANVSVPQYLFSYRLSDKTVVFGQQLIKGTSIIDLPRKKLTKAILVRLWKHLKQMHNSHIAHFDFHPGNAIVDASNHVWIIDFGLSKVTTDEEMLIKDDILMLVGVAKIMKVKEVVQTYLSVMGTSRVPLLLRNLQQPAVAFAGLETFSLNSNVFGKLRKEFIKQSKVEDPGLTQISRISFKKLAAGVIFLIAGQYLLTELQELPSNIVNLLQGNAWLLLIAFLIELLTHIPDALTLYSSTY